MSKEKGKEYIFNVRNTSIPYKLLNNKKYFRGYYKFYDNTHTISKYKDGIIMFYK